MSRTTQKPNKWTGAKAPRDLLAILEATNAVFSSRIFRRNERVLTSHDSSDQVPFSEGEIDFRVVPR